MSVIQAVWMVVLKSCFCNTFTDYWCLCFNNVFTKNLLGFIPNLQRPSLLGGSRRYPYVGSITLFSGTASKKERYCKYLLFDILASRMSNFMIKRICNPHITSYWLVLPSQSHTDGERGGICMLIMIPDVLALLQKSFYKSARDFSRLRRIEMTV